MFYKQDKQGETNIPSRLDHRYLYFSSLAHATGCSTACADHTWERSLGPYIYIYPCVLGKTLPGPESVPGH